MKKIIALILSAIICLLVFCGCSQQNKSKVTITLESSFSNDDTSGAAFSTILEKFKAKEKYITVSHTPSKADDTWKEAIRTEFQSDKEADITFFFTAVDAEPIIQSGKVISIEEIRETYPNYANNIKTDVLDMLKANDGKTYAVPVKGFWEGLMCNKELFKKYNVPSVTDYNSLLNAIKIFNENGITPIAASFSDVPNYWIESMIMSSGGTAIHSVNPKSESEIPSQWIDGLNNFKELYNMNAFSSDCLVSSNELEVASFNSGKAAMLLEGSWANLNEGIKNNIEIVPVPSSNENKNGISIIAGASMGFYISKSAWDNEAKRDACIKAIEFFTSNESISLFCKDGEAPPANIEQNSSATPFVNSVSKYISENKQQLPIDSRLSKPAWEYLRTSIPAILKGTKTPDDVLKKVVEYNLE